MKQLEITEILGSEDTLIYSEYFGDDAVMSVDGPFVRVADDKQCVLIKITGKETIALLPAEVEDDDSLCNSHCECHDTVSSDGKFDCGGACKNRCYECEHQYDIIKGEDHDTT